MMSTNSPLSPLILHRPFSNLQSHTQAKSLRNLCYVEPQTANLYHASPSQQQHLSETGRTQHQCAGEQKPLVTASVTISHLSFIRKIQNNGFMVIILSSSLTLSAWVNPVSLIASCASPMAEETPSTLVVNRILHLLSMSVYTFQNLTCLWQSSFGH